MRDITMNPSRAIALSVDKAEGKTWATERCRPYIGSRTTLRKTKSSIELLSTISITERIKKLLELAQWISADPKFCIWRKLMSFVMTSEM